VLTKCIVFFEPLLNISLIRIFVCKTIKLAGQQNSPKINKRQLTKIKQKREWNLKTKPTNNRKLLERGVAQWFKNAFVLTPFSLSVFLLA